MERQTIFWLCNMVLWLWSYLNINYGFNVHIYRLTKKTQPTKATYVTFKFYPRTKFEILWNLHWRFLKILLIFYRWPKFEISPSFDSSNKNMGTCNPIRSFCPHLSLNCGNRLFSIASKVFIRFQECSHLKRFLSLTILGKVVDCFLKWQQVTCLIKWRCDKSIGLAFVSL